MILMTQWKTPKEVYVPGISKKPKKPLTRISPQQSSSKWTVNQTSAPSVIREFALITFILIRKRGLAILLLIVLILRKDRVRGKRRKNSALV
jgi:hypothetical protein